MPEECRNHAPDHACTPQLSKNTRDFPGEIVIGWGKLRSTLHYFFCFVVLARLQEAVAQIVQVQIVVRFQLDCAPVMCDGFLEPPGFLDAIPQADVVESDFRVRAGSGGV